MAELEPTADELAEFSRILGRLRELPVDDVRRLRAEREAESFSRDGRRARSAVRRQARADADRRLVAETVRHPLVRRPRAARSETRSTSR